MTKVIVVGGGPAGMLAAYGAATCGAQVILLEQNEKLGKKMFITGKGRCNITSDSQVEELIQNVTRNPRFLYSAFYTFSSDAIVALLEENGLKTKVERGKRVFPVSDKSSDVIKTLEKILHQAKVQVRLRTKVVDILLSDGTVSGVRLADGKTLAADRVIMATGGVSYPSTGSDGSGFVMAKKLGIQVEELHPGLIAMKERGDTCAKLQGLTLKNVALTLWEDKKQVFQQQGEMLFTHFGISGPLVLTGSMYVKNPSRITAEIDLKPALSSEKLDARLIRDLEESKNKSFKNMVGGLVPGKLQGVLTEKCQVDPERKCNSITKAERLRIGEFLKHFPVAISGFRPIDEAIITRGGVKVGQINPSTMESKGIKGLFFAGEMIDVDAKTGGFNLQIAYSTGYLAGLTAAGEE